MEFGVLETCCLRGSLLMTEILKRRCKGHHSSWQSRDPTLPVESFKLSPLSSLSYSCKSKQYPSLSPTLILYSASNNETLGHLQFQDAPFPTVFNSYQTLSHSSSQAISTLSPHSATSSVPPQLRFSVVVDRWIFRLSAGYEGWDLGRKVRN